MCFSILFLNKDFTIELIHHLGHKKYFNQTFFNHFSLAQKNLFNVDVVIHLLCRVWPNKPVTYLYMTLFSIALTQKGRMKNELFSFGVTQQGLVFFVANFPRKKKKLLKWRICKLCLWNQDLNFQEPSVAIEPIFNSNMAKWPPDIIVWHIIKAALSINFSSANFTT